MRHYPTNSSQAAGRILALSMMVDGNLAPSELQALERSKILQYIDLDQSVFDALLQELCYDMFSTVAHGTVQLDMALIDSLLAEITQPDLRRQLLRAMWNIADADEWLADAESALLARACIAWSADSSFSDHPHRSASADAHAVGK